MIDDSSHETRDSQYIGAPFQVRHYYHAYAGGAWAGPVREHFGALSRAGLDDTDLTIGLAGPEPDRRACHQRILQLCDEQAIRKPVWWLEADYAWEQLTLQQVYDDVNKTTDEYAVLYMHTKGASRDFDGNTRWRQSMTRQLVSRWEECVKLLADGYDAVGCHWVKAPEWPEQPPFFAGNFWWARASYLRTLDPPLNETRWQPETWISLGNPKIFDLIPGWPSYG